MMRSFRQLRQVKKDLEGNQTQLQQQIPAISLGLNPAAARISANLFSFESSVPAT
jgi:hypothetical protein